MMVYIRYAMLPLTILFMKRCFPLAQAAYAAAAVEGTTMPSMARLQRDGGGRCKTSPTSRRPALISAAPGCAVEQHTSESPESTSQMLFIAAGKRFKVRSPMKRRLLREVEDEEEAF